MRRIFFILLILFSTSNFFYAQTIKIKVVDEDNEIIHNCHFFAKNIELNGVYINDFYIFNVNIGDTLTLKHVNYVSEDYLIPQLYIDTLFHEFVLRQKFQDIDEVKILGTKYQKIAGEMDENILDYLIYPFEKSILFVKSIKNQYFLVLENNLKSTTTKLDSRPQYLFLDCMGNTHLVAKDSVYQLWLTDTIKYVSVISKNIFESNLKNLVSKTENDLYMEEITLHNQNYTINKKSKDTKGKIIYNSFDKIAFKVAKSEYNAIIRKYYEVTPIGNNLIENGIWDGDVIKLGDTYLLNQMITWYLKIRAKPIECSSYGMIDNIVTINFFEDSIIKLDYNAELVSKSKLNAYDLKNKVVIFDYFYNNLYIKGNIDNNLNLYKVNTDSGNKTKISDFEGVNPTKLKVVGNEIYFLDRNDAGYNKLFKMQF